MLVDVVCLRRDGAKLPPEEVRAAKPVRRLLTIDTMTPGSPSPESARLCSDVARLWRCENADSAEPVDGLECASVSRIGGDGLLVVGVECRSNSSGHPQAWWCRVIVEADSSKAAIGGAPTRPEMQRDA
jgi:hypothetical protein